MEPLYFGAPERPLFGVYHAAQSTHGPEASAVLCYPAGQEGLRSHRAFVALATRFASSGVHCLRFDYDSTGDSAGDSSEGSLERWRGDVGRAVRELKDGTGARSVTLVGLRLGATLAAQAAMADRSVDSVVLWCPIVDGRRHLAELRAGHRAWLRGSFARPRRGPEGETGEEILGFPLGMELAAEIEAVDLLGLAERPAARALVISHGAPRAPDAASSENFRDGDDADRRDAERLAAHLSDLGSEVTTRAFAVGPTWSKASDALDANSMGTSLVPVPALEAIVAWVAAGGRS